MELVGAIVSLLAGVVTAIVLYLKQKGSGQSPEEQSKADLERINDALVNGDLDTVNAMFDKLRKAGCTPADPSNGYDDSKKPG
jgi:hypothetical protein